MTDFLIPLVKGIAKSNYFSPTIGLFYIVAKIFFRHLIHSAINHVYDFWSTLAWFSVDLCLLSLAVCAGSKAHAKMGFTHEETIFLYAVFVSSLLLVFFAYLFFTQRRDGLENIRPYKDARLAAYMTFSWFVGFAWFWTVLEALK
jgi:hypothetical protein